MAKLLGSGLLVGGLMMLAVPGSAQRRAADRPAQRLSFGVEANWSSDVDFGIGGRAVFPLRSLIPKTPLDGIVSFDYYFPSHPSGTTLHYLEINGNVAYRFTVRGSSLGPYAGGGLNIAHASSSVTFGTTTISGSDTKAGLNLLGGTTFKLKGSKLTPFVDAHGEIGGGKNFIITGGVRF